MTSHVSFIEQREGWARDVAMIGIPCPLYVAKIFRFMTVPAKTLPFVTAAAAASTQAPGSTRQSVRSKCE